MIKIRESKIEDAKHIASCVGQVAQERKYLANLALIAKLQLNQLGIFDINELSHCTFSRKNEYFSYRRDGKTGRMATLICRQ